MELVLDDVRGFVEVNFVVSLEQAQCLELDVDKLELLEYIDDAVLVGEDESSLDQPAPVARTSA